MMYLANSTAEGYRTALIRESAPGHGLVKSLREHYTADCSSLGLSKPLFSF
jgi:hypothetical protein